VVNSAGAALSRGAQVRALLLGALGDRLFPQPIRTADALAVFVGQRAAYVGQTALYGYLKTRMGTRFPEYFEDDDFSASIRTAAIGVFAACAADLTVYAVARVGRDGGLGAEDAAALARRSYPAALAAGLEPADRNRLPVAAVPDFEARIAATDWAAAGEGGRAFAGSANTLIRLAPVSDEYRTADAEIVRNSIRLRWIDVRAQLDRRLDRAAVLEDWAAAAG